MTPDVQLDRRAESHKGNNAQYRYQVEEVNKQIQELHEELKSLHQSMSSQQWHLGGHSESRELEVAHR